MSCVALHWSAGAHPRVLAPGCQACHAGRRCAHVAAGLAFLEEHSSSGASGEAALGASGGRVRPGCRRPPFYRGPGPRYPQAATSEWQHHGAAGSAVCVRHGELLPRALPSRAPVLTPSVPSAPWSAHVRCTPCRWVARRASPWANLIRSPCARPNPRMPVSPLPLRLRHYPRPRPLSSPLQCRCPAVGAAADAAPRARSVGSVATASVSAASAPSSPPPPDSDGDGGGDGGGSGGCGGSRPPSPPPLPLPPRECSATQFPVRRAPLVPADAADKENRDVTLIITIISFQAYCQLIVTEGGTSSPLLRAEDSTRSAAATWRRRAGGASAWHSAAAPCPGARKHADPCHSNRHHG